MIFAVHILAKSACGQQEVVLFSASFRQFMVRSTDYGQGETNGDGAGLLKSILGEKLGARSEQGQDKELLLRCAVLNQMTSLGLPDSYAL